jgi:hypothetical protein
MRTSEHTNEISAALSKAQGEIKNPDKSRTAKYPTKTGAMVQYNYADLAACFDAAREALSKHGLAHVVTTGYVETHYTLFCRLTHTSGQWYQSEWPLPNDGDPKTIGAHITYGTRYLFTSLLGMAGEEDMDDAPEGKGEYGTRTPPKPSGATPPVVVTVQKPIPVVNKERTPRQKLSDEIVAAQKKMNMPDTERAEWVMNKFGKELKALTLEEMILFRDELINELSKE